MKNKINKIIALMTLVIMLLNIFPLFDLKYLFNTKSEVYADGISYNGQTQKGTYTISTKEQLNTLSQKVNSGTTYEGSTFVLQNNIDFGKQIIRYGYGDVLNVNFTRIGTKDNPFMGTLDGNNKKISNIVIEAIGNSAQDDADNERVYVGFIGHLKNGVVKNLEITAFRQKDINLNTKWHGILVGVNSGKIENCYISEDDEHLYIDTYYNDGRLRHEDKTSKSMVWINYGDIINSHNKYSLNVYSSWTDTENGILAACAGIATYNYGNIKNCSNIATKEIIHNADRIAHGYSGIVHRNYGLIENCFNKANIRSHQAAGISMYNEGNIKNCYNLGRIYGTDGFSFGVAGGIVYYNSNTIEYSYNVGEIFGVVESGGISAYSTDGKISYCYNKGNVSGGFQYAKEWGAYIGGIVGQANSTVVNYCYNVGYVSGNNAGGIVGYRTNAQLISNCYNAGKVSTTDSPGGDNWEYPIGDSLKSAGSIIGYNLRWLHIKDLVLNQDYYYVSEYGEDRPNGRPGPLLYSHGFYTGNSEYININNTYYYQSEPHYTFSGHLLARDGMNSHGQTTYAFADIHGTDKKYGKTLEQMQSQEFVDLLNVGGVKVFVRDTGELKVNNGFPIFKWQQVVTGIEVVGDTNIEENLFNTFTLNTLPAEIEDITFTWKADDESIVNIIIVGNGKSAVINGLKKGFTTVTVTANDKNKYSVSFIVRVVSPSIQGKDRYYLVGEEIEYLNGYYDEETDPKYRDEFKYIHTYNRLEVGISLDNSLGQINYNNRWLGDRVNSFSKVGAYEVNYRVQDNPSTANKLNFENYRYYSEQVNTTIYIHRKPIAYYSINNNKVTDESYDLDHSISYSNKGIIQWEWTYVNEKGNFEKYVTTNKIDGQNKVNDWLSTYLNTNYELLLRVKDMELTWSDVYSTNQVAKIQFNANLRTELEKFSLNNVPASENLISFDIWTKYPKDLKLQLVLCNDVGLEVAPIKEINYSATTAIKMGHEIYWNDILYNIPAIHKSGNYIMKIKAIDVLNPLIFSTIDFNITVNTPINLQPVLPSLVRAGKDTKIIATTSKYVNSAYTGSNVKVTLFEGTSYARTLTMNGTTTNWDITTTLEKTIPQGVYKAKFVATLPSGEFEVKELTYNYVVNTAPVITDGEIFAELGGNYIYENDDVNFRLKFHDVDLSSLTVDVKLYNSNNLTTPIRTYTKVVSPNGSVYADHIIRLIDDIPIGDYRVVATVTDDYNESATITKDFTAHDLWITGTVTHTDKWEENRQNYNTKYPLKVRDKNTYWNGESFETNANTTIINKNSNVICNKVSIEIINSDRPSDIRYLQWLNSDNITNDRWKLSYWNKEWIRKDGYVITKWGSDKKQELTLRFTAYFNNDWVETYDVKVYIDDQDDYWKLHRAW